MNSKMKVIGTLCVFGTTIGYGLLPSISFLSFEAGVETETLLFSKFFYSAVLVWIYIGIKKFSFKLEKEAIKPMIVVCIAYIGIATTLYFAFDYISGSLATIVSFTFPAMIVAIEMIRKIEPVRIVKIMAVVLSTIGMIFVVWSPDMSGNIIGIFFALGTAISYVFYIFGLAAPAIKKTNSFVVSGYILAASAVFNLVRCLLSGQPVMVSNMEQFGYMLFLSTVCAFAAILLNAIGVKLIGAGNAAIINTVEPLIAVIFGYILVGDILTTNMMLGGALIMVAVLISNLPSKKKDPSLEGGS